MQVQYGKLSLSYTHTHTRCPLTFPPAYSSFSYSIKIQSQVKAPKTQTDRQRGTKVIFYRGELSSESSQPTGFWSVAFSPRFQKTHPELGHVVGPGAPQYSLPPKRSLPQKDSGSSGCRAGTRPQGMGPAPSCRRGGPAEAFGLRPARVLIYPVMRNSCVPQGSQPVSRGPVSPLQCFDKRRGAGSTAPDEESSFSPQLVHQPRANLLRGNPDQRWASLYPHYLRVFSVTEENDRSWRGQKDPPQAEEAG